MKHSLRKIIIGLAFLGTIVLAPVGAAMTGNEVMQQVYTRPNGNNMSANLVMTLTNNRGSTRERSIVQFRQDDGATEKKLMFFTAPADVRDTSFLNFSYSDGRSDDQWIYLPALKRVKRIASDNTGDSFMGSDFTYDDMGERHPSEDRHTVLRQETIDGWDVFVVESIPVDPKETYTRTVSWIVDGEWIGLKKEFYTADGKLGKTLGIDAFEKIDDIWVITDMTMANVQKNTSTRIQMKDVSFNNDLADSFFSERQMRIGPRT